MMKKLHSQRKHDARLEAGARLCSVAAAVVGSAVIGGVASSSASSKAAKAASNSASDTAASSERVAMAQLEFAKQQDADNKVRLAKADELTEKVAGKQLEAMDQNLALAKDYDEYNKSTYRPLEQSIVEEAKNYDSPEEQERAAGAASASVKKNIAQANDANQRTLARMGVNPNSGRAMVTANETAISGALGEAAAENSARTSVKTLGAAKRMDAASLGRNLPSAQATSAGLGISAGNSAVNNTATTNGTAISGANSVGGLYNSAGNQFSNASANYSRVASAATAAGTAAAAPWGQIGGMALSYAMKTPPVSSGSVPNVLF